MRIAWRMEGRTDKGIAVTFVRACDTLSKEEIMTDSGNVYFSTYKKPVKGGGIAVDHSSLVSESLFKNLESVSNKEGSARGSFDGVVDLPVVTRERKTFRKSPTGKTYTEMIEVPYPDLSDRTVRKSSAPILPFSEKLHKSNYHEIMEARKRARRLPDVHGLESSMQPEEDLEL